MSIKLTAPRFRGFLALGAFFTALPAHAQQAKLPQTALRSPYLGDHKDYTLPIDNRPTIVVLVDSTRTLLPMELIRGLRLVEKFGDSIRLAVVYAGRDPKLQADVTTAIEQRSVLDTGLKAAPKFEVLLDRSGKWLDELGRPGLPHAMLVSADGMILAREILLGGFTAEVARIEQALDSSTSPKSKPATRDVTADAIIKTVADVPLRPPGANAARLSRRARTVQRIDAEAILKKLAETQPATAHDTIRDYCKSGLTFSLIQRFANSALTQFGLKDCDWAREIINSRVDGLVSVDHWQLGTSINVENYTSNLKMWVSVHCRLESRWNGNTVAELRQSGFFNPGSEVYLTNDKFETLNAGWGDYVVHNKVEVSMSEGEYPNNHTFPSLTREWKAGVTYFPRNEYAEEINLNDENRSPELIAFRDGLNQSLQTASMQSASPRSLVENVLSNDTLSRVGQWIGHHSRQLTGSASTAGRPFKEMTVASWVQGQEQFGTNGPGVLTPPKGKALLVDFMFVNCPPCQAALPELSALHDEFNEQGLVVVSLATSWGSRGIYDLMRKKAARHSFAVLAENEEKQYGVTSFPTLLLVDRRGKVRWSGIGEPPSREIIRTVLNEAP